MRLGFIVNYRNNNSAIIRNGQCIKPALRQEIRDLSKEDYNRLVYAINKLHERKPNERYTKFEKMVRLHVSYYDIAHGVPAFLPWHRYYIRLFELELQKIDQNIVLPYWDWSHDARHPENSPVLTDYYMGGQGDKRQDYCVKSGPFKNWMTLVDYPHCLSRRYDEGEVCSPFPNPEEVLFLTNMNLFSDFSYELEMAHGSPHTAIGSDPGDFGISISPNDPLFYLHHAFVDLIYDLWLKKRNLYNFKYEGFAFNNFRVSVNDLLKPFNRNVYSTFNSKTNFFCYEYAEYPRRLQPNNEVYPIKKEESRAIKLPRNKFTNPALSELGLLDVNSVLKILQSKAVNNTHNSNGAGRSSSIFNSEKLKPRKPLPERWLKQNKFDSNKVRQIENRNEQLIDAFNNLPVYVPLAE
ncbi:Di-copper centre-containing protein [Neoconidiobolus thromboides FSU 785]|nr:Di-copper centre-containing protein [Neoconidiobolus thromboides FSU 785]